MAYSCDLNYDYATCPHCGRRVGYTQNLCDDCRRQYKPKTPTIEAQLLGAEMRVAELLAKKEAMAKFGSDDVYGEDDAILFKTNFGRKGGRVYTYVAVKTPRGWFITGTNSTSMSFEALVENHLISADEVWVCKEWGQI